MQKLIFIQNFNAMRTFLSMYYDKTHLGKIGTLCGAFNLWKDHHDWKNNPNTFDPAVWQDWMDGVNTTLQVLKINQDPKSLLFTEDVAFLCMQNCLQTFYDQTSWQDVKSLVESLKQAKHIDTDPVWQEWQQAIQHVLNNSYELDVYFDPFTGDRM